MCRRGAALQQQHWEQQQHVKKKWAAIT